MCHRRGFALVINTDTLINVTPYWFDVDDNNILLLNMIDSLAIKTIMAIKSRLSY